MSMKWRIITNKYNLRDAPWRGAVGIEEDEPDLAVPAIVCWFTRGWDLALIQQVIDTHNGLDSCSQLRTAVIEWRDARQALFDCKPTPVADAGGTGMRYDLTIINRLANAEHDLMRLARSLRPITGT
jgi:hypothetical protein